MFTSTVAIDQLFAQIVDLSSQPEQQLTKYNFAKGQVQDKDKKYFYRRCLIAFFMPIEILSDALDEYLKLCNKIDIPNAINEICRSVGGSTRAINSGVKSSIKNKYKNALTSIITTLETDQLIELFKIKKIYWLDIEMNNWIFAEILGKKLTPNEKKRVKKACKNFLMKLFILFK